MAKKPLELESLKWPFVGLAVLLALSSGWAVYDEVFARRPWKNYQREFFHLESKHLREDLARMEKRLQAPATKAQRDAALAELKAASDAISGNPQQRKAYEDTVKADEKAQIDEADAKLDLGFAKSESDAIYYKVREARHEGHKEEELSLQRQMDKWEAEIKKRDERYQKAIARHQETSKARLAFLSRRDQAQAALDKFDKPVVALKERIAASDSKWPQMEQYWIENLKNSWEGPTVDRCQNCHAGVDKGGFSAPWEVIEAKRNKLPAADFKTQFAIDDEVVDEYQAVYEKLCERVPEEPVAMPVGGFKPPAAPAMRTERKADDVCKPRKDYDKLLTMAQAYCGHTGSWVPKTKVVFIDKKGAVVSGEAAEKAPWACYEKDVAAQLDEAVKADAYDVKPVYRTHPARFELLVKAHLPEQYGCTTCHGGEGSQTKGVMHHSFRHGRDDHHWNDPLTEEITVMGKKYPGAFLQAKCDKCHTGELNVNHAPLLAKGKKLFTDLGCWGCHPAEGYNDLAKRGPTLVNIAAKTTPGWLQTWIAYPRGWRPGSRMPNFWPGAVDPKAVPAALDARGKPHPEGLSDQQLLASHKLERDDDVRAIAAYLWSNSDRPRLRELPAGGDAKKGKELVESVGCRACHVFDKGDAARRSEGSKERDYAPNLYNIADKARPDWIYSWIKNPKALWPGTKMPDLRLTDAEAADITVYLTTLKTDQTYPDGDLFAGGDQARLQQAARKGREVISKYGCFGCHDIKGFETAQKIGTELTEHGRKDAHLLDFGDVRYFTENPKERETYANWVWMKLSTPRIYAYERVESRMPQFDFSDDEKLAVLTFLKGQTGEKPPAQYLTATDPNKAAVQQGERLVFWNGCRNCHIVEKRGGTIRDRFNEDDQSYAPPILNGEGWKTQPQWLFSFLKDPVGPAAEGKNLRPWIKIRMPTFHFSDDEATNLVKFFSAASAKPYPYLTPREGEKPSREHLAEANSLFEELKCMSCHVVGEMKPGQDPSSAAPDLLLAKSRLRPDWIPAWLQNPQALMDGTRMPSFWDFADPKKPVAPSKTFHGDAKGQVEALRDLLMYLGDEKQQAPKRAETEQPKPRKRG